MSETLARDTEARKRWMSVLATAPADRLAELWAAVEERPDYELLRAPEIGLVMAQGRIGGTGGPFNMGEMTVTRCTVRLRDPQRTGHAYLAGRDHTKAETAAVLDAMLQAPDRFPGLADTVVEPLAKERAARDAARAAKVAATKVDFFTMVRGED